MEDKKKAGTMASPESSSSNDTSVGGVLFADLKKRDTERVRIHVKAYKGHDFIDIRVWYLADNGEFKPSSKGLTIRPALAYELIQGIDLAARSIDPKEGA
ncbi:MULTISPECIES: transcriptional coactivator p15/PC4 family protein [unclassified Caballeronia]|uniref:transcriptional coactivator p15/PC4 family protein n=1 Tax=unclassified Caballeronia TaxID=2646786 RepID=UPI00285F078E|nr:MULTISPECIES: transcriptional coactivator p15/PC4 family protein [unclassified Caballeronia]MDR5770872.1 transcriptional coactivator p15/PC4 family protein [Caballeronia sp. LZ002]MDR5846309.1 transcriptional coactivator p15/PC4 family protein [Caballeronia sp. LZ003]